MAESDRRPVATRVGSERRGRRADALRPAGEPPARRCDSRGRPDRPSPTRSSTGACRSNISCETMASNPSKRRSSASTSPRARRSAWRTRRPAWTAPVSPSPCRESVRPRREPSRSTSSSQAPCPRNSTRAPRSSRCAADAPWATGPRQRRSPRRGPTRRSWPAPSTRTATTRRSSSSPGNCNSTPTDSSPSFATKCHSIRIEAPCVARAGRSGVGPGTHSIRRTSSWLSCERPRFPLATSRACSMRRT